MRVGMKKNIFLIMCLLVLNYVRADERVHELELDEEQENVTVQRCENADEFEDFFRPDDEDVDAPRQQKPKLSRMQLVMIRLGVAVALRVENCYDSMCAMYRYLKSWVISEKRKA